MNASAAPAPLAPDSPLPHRKVIRGWLLPLSARDTRRALGLVALDLALFGGLLTAIVRVPMWWAKLPLAIVCGFVIGRLFILGHDACHMSFTRHKALNRWIGRLVFLPSLTPYSLWATGHNLVHHGYTNLKDFDFVWRPKTLDEYRALPAWGRALERIYRSGWAPWLDYLVEVWWMRMFFPSRAQMPTRRRAFFWDCVLVSVVAAAWIAGLAWAAAASGQSVVWMLAAGFVLPFGAWNAMIGFVVYVHHTHEAVAWYDDKSDWAEAQPFVSTTVHLRFPRTLGLDWSALMHHITEHTAHHVDMGIPLYRLKAAQQLLERTLPGRILIQRFSWRWYFATARRCKLYDYRARRWTDFGGRPTAAPAAL